jgi:hypothetical protein
VGGGPGRPCDAEGTDAKVDGGGALHLVHTVDVEVRNTVEMVLVVSKLVLPPLVCVKVIGHVVTVETTISVVMTSVGLVAGAGDVLTDAGGEPAGGEPAGGVDCGRTDVEEGG